jgi:hypothetical protein
VSTGWFATNAAKVNPRSTAVVAVLGISFLRNALAGKRPPRVVYLFYFMLLATSFV